MDHACTLEFDVKPADLWNWIGFFESPTLNVQRTIEIRDDGTFSWRLHADLVVGDEGPPQVDGTILVMDAVITLDGCQDVVSGTSSPAQLHLRTAHNRRILVPDDSLAAFTETGDPAHGLLELQEGETSAIDVMLRLQVEALLNDAEDGGDD